MWILTWQQLAKLDLIWPFYQISRLYFLLLGSRPRHHTGLGTYFCTSLLYLIASVVTASTNCISFALSLWCATHRRCNQLSTIPLEVCGVRVPPTGTVRDLGILLEANMQMTGHVRQLVSRCFRQLRLIKSCIRSLPFEAAKTVVACFVITQVDRCNSLLAGTPKCLLDRLQSVLNSAAKLVCNRRKYDHVTPLLRDRYTGFRCLFMVLRRTT